MRMSNGSFIRSARALARGALLFAWCLQFAAPSAAAGRAAAEGGIAVRLFAEPRAVATGGTVTFTLRFANGDDAARRLLLPTCYAGQDFEFRDAAGETVEWDGGLATHTVKMGVYPGRTILLSPGATAEVRFRAHLASGLRLLFEDPGAAFGTGFSPGSVAGADLDGIPPAFIGCGRMFRFKAPGKVSVRCVYERRPSDAEWRVLPPEGEDGSLDALWVGRAESEPVDLELR